MRGEESAGLAVPAGDGAPGRPAARDGTDSGHSERGPGDPGLAGRRWALDPDRVLFGVAGCFAVWTVLCHATVLVGGSLDQLIAAAAATMIVAGAGWWFVRRPRRRCTPAAPRGTQELSAGGTPLWLAIGATGAGLATPLLVMADQPLTAWGTALAAVGAATATVLWRSRPDPRPAAAATPLIWALAAAMALVAAVANRPDVDDALYLNLAVGAVDSPSAPLLAVDHLHGVAGVPLDPATYRFYTLEPALAAATRLTGIAPITWAHLVLPPLAAVLMVLAWARLVRLLAPARWREVLLALLAILLVVGNTHAWYGNVGLVRLHQGKCLFASIAVPLVLAAALELAARPGRRPWGRLVAAVLAGVGLTGTALWLLPALTAVGIVAGGPPPCSHRLRTWLAAAAAATYPLLLGLAIVVAAHRPGSALGRSVMGPAAAAPSAPSLAAAPGPPRGRGPSWRLAPMRFAVSYVLGEGALPAVVALVAVGLWWLSPEARARRLALAAALGFLAVLFNPWLSLWLSDHVTGRPTYWRGFWLLPVPLLLALATTAPAVRLRRLGRPTAMVATAALLVVVTRVPLLAAANHVRLAPGELKVPPVEYAVARRVVAAASAGAAVIAPEDVAAWITTFRHHPCPLLVRRTFFAMVARAVPAADARRRTLAAAAVTAARLEPETLAAFADALHRYQVAAVVLPRSNPNAATLQRTLRAAGFHPTYHGSSYELWVQPRRAAPSAPF